MTKSPFRETFDESLRYYLYLTYFPLFLGWAFSSAEAFKDWQGSTRFFCIMYIVVYFYDFALARGNVVDTGTALVQVVIGKLPWSSLLPIVGCQLVGALTVAIPTEIIFRETVFFAQWDVNRNYMVCFIIELCCTTVHFIGMLSTVMLKEWGTERGLDLSHIKHISIFCTVVAIVLGVPYTQGGASLAFMTTLMSGIHHRNWRMTVVLGAADLMAPLLAARFLHLDSGNMIQKENEKAENNSSPRRPERQMPTRMQSMQPQSYQHLKSRKLR